MTSSPTRLAISWRRDGEEHELACDFIAGCDGFHGICRPSIPGCRARRVYERIYPFAWLGILARAAPSHDELIYAYHERGFALFSMRSPEITRLYLQCAPDEDLGELAGRRESGRSFDARLETGDGWKLNEGPMLQKGITPMRSFVVRADAARPAVPRRRRRAHRAADRRQGHEPGDRRRHACSRAPWRRTSSRATARRSSSYSGTCLARVWRAEHFSWWMTSMLHRFPGDDPFQRRLQRSQLDYTVQLARGRRVARGELRRVAIRLTRHLGSRSHRGLRTTGPNRHAVPSAALDRAATRPSGLGSAIRPRRPRSLAPHFPRGLDDES